MLTVFVLTKIAAFLLAHNLTPITLPKHISRFGNSSSFSKFKLARSEGGKKNTKEFYMDFARNQWPNSFENSNLKFYQCFGITYKPILNAVVKFKK